VDAFMCYKQKCKAVSLNLAHPVEHAIYILTNRLQRCFCQIICWM